MKDNPLEKYFWGRIPVQRATAFCFFQKGNRLQRLIHQLKYQGRTDIGQFLGRLFGEELKESTDFAGIELIVPVPLHRSRLLQRGYNQVDFVCQGLSEALQKPWSTKALLRAHASESQTRKGRFERWANVAEVFTVPDETLIASKHLLLVDDVITTGSTLESAARTLLDKGAASICVATLGCSVK
ncbi:MAG: ComF family protein [Chitinophagales bacterium]|nr:ComF family protein [Chitinophagales bacterium]MDW8428565.1 ComF family protein [Chitinophagales bacterium]